MKVSPEVLNAAEDALLKYLISKGAVPTGVDEELFLPDARLETDDMVKIVLDAAIAAQ